VPAVSEYKYMALRRISQATIMLLFVAGNILGWHVLRGNLSTSRILDTIPLADPFAVLQILAAGKFISVEALLGALIVVLFFGLIAGRSFCSWICPVNILTDLANWMRRRMNIDSEGKKTLMRRRTRYWVMCISLLISLFTGVAAFEWISPISMLHRGVIFGMGIGWMMVVSVFLFDLFIVKNGFCGHLCPLGGFYSLLGMFSLVKVNHRKETCTLCMKCIEACPEGQVLTMVGRASGAVVSGECTNCARCIEVCDDYAMSFGIRKDFIKK
jgi:ferredoxin-type protein NapH